MKRLLAVTPFALLLSAQAFAWHGDGRPGPGQSPLPVDVTNASTTQPSADFVIVRANISNRSGLSNLVCDIQAQVDAKRNFDVVTVTSYADKAEIDYGTAFDGRFNFRSGQFAQGFKMDKASQRYNSSCLTLDSGENPSQVPEPHTKCDPDMEKCGFTCPAAPGNPDQCGSAGF